jgi:hypothetical protein
LTNLLQLCLPVYQLAVASADMSRMFGLAGSSVPAPHTFVYITCLRYVAVAWVGGGGGRGQVGTDHARAGLYGKSTAEQKSGLYRK